MSYVTKMGAYGFAVVAAFAVALAVLLSVSSTSDGRGREIRPPSTPDGDEHSFRASTRTGTAQNGDTVYIADPDTSGYVLFEISAVGQGLGVKFTHSKRQTDGGQSIYCTPTTTTANCDVDNWHCCVYEVALKIGQGLRLRVQSSSK